MQAYQGFQPCPIELFNELFRRQFSYINWPGITISIDIVRQRLVIVDAFLVLGENTKYGSSGISSVLSINRHHILLHICKNTLLFAPFCIDRITGGRGLDLGNSCIEPLRIGSAGIAKEENAVFVIAHTFLTNLEFLRDGISTFLKEHFKSHLNRCHYITGSIHVEQVNIGSGNHHRLSAGKAGIAALIRNGNGEIIQAIITDVSLLAILYGQRGTSKRIAKRKCIVSRHNNRSCRYNTVTFDHIGFRNQEFFFHRYRNR